MNLSTSPLTVMLQGFSKTQLAPSTIRGSVKCFRMHLNQTRAVSLTAELDLDRLVVSFGVSLVIPPPVLSL